MLKASAFSCLMLATASPCLAGMDFGEQPPLSQIKVAAQSWTLQEPGSVEVSQERGKDLAGSVRFEAKPGGKPFAVLEGPLVKIPKRGRFCANRVFKISLSAKTAGMEGNSFQIRLRQFDSSKKGEGFYAKSLCPVSSFDNIFEIGAAHKYRSWGALEGSGSLAPAADSFRLELWIAAPKAQGEALWLKDVELREEFRVAPLFMPSPGAPGNIFFDGKGSMKVEFPSPERLKSCEVQVVDEAGRRLALYDGGAFGIAAVELPSKGFYRLEANASYSDGSALSCAVNAAVVGESMPDSVRLKSRFGVKLSQGSRAFSNKSACNWDWGIGNINLKDYVREPDGRIHPPQGMKPLKSPADHSSIFSINELPSWLYAPDERKGEGVLMPKDSKALEDLLEAFAKANPELDRLCPFNEPDAGWRGSTEDFVKLHKAISAGLKRGNPNFKMYGPCMYSIRMKVLKKFVAAGLFDCLDGLMMHAYVNATAPEGEFMDNVLELVEFLKAEGKAAWPLYITEFGWCSVSGDWQRTIPELDRSQYLSRAMALLGTQPVDCIVDFCFQRVLEPSGYSLLFKDGTPSPAYVSYVNAANWLAWTKRGDGSWLRLSPNLNIAFFDNGSRAVAVAWGAEGEGSLKLPGRPLRGEDMMGRPLPRPEGLSVAVGQSPSFFEMESCPSFKGMELLPLVSAAPGGSVKLPWEPFFAPPEFKVSGQGAWLAPDAKPGLYLLIGKSDGKWQGQPVKALTPLTLQGMDYQLSADGRSLSVVASLLSSLDGGAEASMKLKLEDGRSFESKARLPKGVPSPVFVAIPDFLLGVRYKGGIEISLLGGTPSKIERKLDQTVLGCPSLPEDSSSGVNWQAAAAVDFSSWGHWPKPVEPSDCSGAMKAAAGPKGFHLLVDVLDDIHSQSQPPGGMWKEDSIQIAFDLDADKEWQPNNIATGLFNGHRVFEYGVGLPSKGGQPMVWRYRADAPDFKAACPEPKVRAEVRRKDGRTIYDIFLPWETLAMPKAPQPGSSIGFALLVNDLDKSGERHCLKLFDGIVGPKDPELYGKLRVLEPSPQGK